MSIEGIIKRISDDADQKIAALEKENREAIDALEAETKSKIAEIEADAKKRAEIEKERSFRQTFAREEARLRKELLAAKQKIVAEIFDRAKKAILELPPEQLRERYLSMLESFGENSGKLIVGKTDAPLFDAGFLQEAVKRIEDGVFEVETASDFEHGFMLIAGKVQYDARFEPVFHEIIEEKTDVVAGVLFPAKGDDA
ncbi:hypothetical protein J7L01_02910 [bacterium]|nr:hypothetical protein [bacterium]